MLVALLLMLQSNSLLQSQFERISPDVASARVSRCGLGTITVRHDDELQEDVLIPSAAAAPTDTQLACAEKAVSFYTLELPPDVQRRFDAIRAARLKPIIVADARAQLAKQGLLDRLPAYNAGKTDDGAFAKELERLCGSSATGALTSSYGPHAVSPNWVIRGGFAKPHQKALTCITNATTAAGFDLHLIGNEAH